MINITKDSKVKIENIDSLIDSNGEALSNDNKNVISGEMLSWGYVEVESLNDFDSIKIKGVNQLIPISYISLINPEDSAEKTISTEGRATEILREKESSKLIKDTAPLIGGARKVKDAYKTISIEDLFKLGDNDVAIRDIITKDRVFPKINIPEEREKGVLSGTVYAKNEIQKAFRNKPEINTSIGRKAYVLLLGTIKDALSPVKTISELKVALNVVLKSFIYSLYNIVDPDKSAIIANEISEKIENSNNDVDYHFSDTNSISELENELIQSIFNSNSNYYSRSNVNDRLLDYFFNKKTFSKINSIDFSLCEKYDGLGIEKVDHNISLLERDIFRLKTEIESGELKIELFTRFLEQFKSDFSGERISLIEIQNQLIKKPLSGYEYRMRVKSPKSIRSFKNDYWSEQNVYDYMDKYGMPIIDGIDVLKEVIERSLPYIKSSIKKSHEVVVKKQVEIEEQKTYVNENWSWFDGIKDTSQKAVVKKINRSSVDGIPTINSGTPLSFIKRVGGYLVDEDNFTTIDKYIHFYKKYLGMSRIQFGLSLNDKERIQYMKHFAGSLIDLFEILDMDPVYLNSIGDLGIQFASAGKGRAMAHYSPSSISINLTRSQGDGTVAHEMAHYLDNLFSNIGKNIGNWGVDVFMSDVYKETKKWYPDIYGNNLTDSIGQGNNLNLYVVQWLKFITQNKISNSVILDEQAMEIAVKNNYTSDSTKSTFDFIIVGREINTSVESDILKKIKNIVKKLPDSEFTKSYFDSEYNIIDINKSDDNFIQSCLEILFNGARFDQSYYADLSKYTDQIFTIPDYKELSGNKDLVYAVEVAITMFGRQSFSMKMATDRTVFFSWASAMDSSKSKKYWSSNVELFARSFETYILTKMQEKGMTNNFLISSDWYSSKAYPQGDERIMINSFFDKIFFEVKQTLNIPSFSIDIKERVDEYIDLSGKSIIPDSGITVDNKTLEVIELEGDASNALNSIERKIGKLLKSLKISKPSK